jgi:serine/threonine protein kinase
VGTSVAQEGTTSNRYTIIGRIAAGGMADIFIAKSTNDAGIERYVVLKRVLAERSRDAHFATMFFDEARLAAQLQHPNIAQVHDIGKLGGSYFYTMEYVHGEDARRLLGRLSAAKRKLPINLAIYIATSALAGLQHAHTRTGSDGKPLGVVHRDVSPANLMISYEGAVKLLDFGVAKASERTAESRAGTIKGKIAYLSPEQCHGGAIDSRSDLYSLGIVLHELLTCRRLYRRDSDFKTMLAITMEETPPPSRFRPDVSAALEHVVMTALEKDLAKRYATAGDMIEALEAVAAAEHHVLSTNAMSRFMRELFGERPQPWLVPPVEDETRTITVTDESLVGIEGMAATVIGPPPSLESGPIEVQQALEEQLEHAPVLQIGDSLESGEIAQTGGSWEEAPMSEPRQPEGAGPPAVSVATLAGTPAPAPAPAPVATPAPATAPAPVARATRPSSASMTTGVAAPPSRRSRRLAVVAAVAATLIVGAIVIVRLVGSDASAPPPAHDAAAITTSPPPEPVAAPPPPPAPVIDAAVVAAAPVIDAAVVAAAPVDAAVPVTPVDAGAIGIADAVAAHNWTAALARCAARAPKTLSADEIAACGHAACSEKRRAVALKYYQLAAEPHRNEIETACRASGVSLAPPASTGHEPRKDPCDDPKYAEMNPLRCQK